MHMMPKPANARMTLPQVKFVRTAAWLSVPTLDDLTR